MFRFANRGVAQISDEIKIIKNILFILFPLLSDLSVHLSLLKADLSTNLGLFSAGYSFLHTRLGEISIV